MTTELVKTPGIRDNIGFVVSNIHFDGRQFHNKTSGGFATFNCRVAMTLELVVMDL